MKKTVKIDLGGRICDFAEIGDGIYRFVIETELPDKEKEVTNDVQDDLFVLVEASKLSLDDKFMRYKPKRETEKKFKELLTVVIKKGVKDFYRPKYDPSFNKDSNGVIFKAGEKPAVGMSYNWWAATAKKFMPKRYSRLGTKSEYVAFLGVLIKKLVEDKKWSFAKAWEAVCEDSKELGHYWNSEDSKHEFEDTGMREICGFFDLANTRKILAKDEDDCIGGFWLAGGFCNYFSYCSPLADLDRYTHCDYYYGSSVGWFVLS